MRKQEQIWKWEHSHQKALPMVASVKAQSGLVSFVEYLTKQHIEPPRKVVDIGCGQGRNAIYLATLGYEVFGLDYIPFAIEAAFHLAREKNVSDRVHCYCAEIDKRWPFADHFFDIAIDCFSSVNIETPAGRSIYKQEMYRTLKPGGYAFVTVVSANDEIESKLIKQSPGEEKNSTIWPDNGKFQKDYDERELREFYQEFHIVELKETRQAAFKLGRKFTATNYWIVLMKPE